MLASCMITTLFNPNATGSVETRLNTEENQ
jgi:hypothetical protein